MSYNLFLDDTRDPKDAYLYDEKKSLFEETFTVNWIVVRNYESFVKVIRDMGLPQVVSFDHDLHFEHVRHYAEQTLLTGCIDYEIFNNKTGKHCADFLVQYAREKGQPLPTCYVHSANDHGRKNIKRALGL